MSFKNLSWNKLRNFFFILVLILVTPSVTSTEIESGYIQAGSTGTITEDIGFRPDYIEFISAQQIESTDFAENDPSNNDCPDNVNGWSEGSAIFDSSGVDKQFAIGMFRNSDSTNGHRTASSTSDVIKNIYTDRDGNQCGTLEMSVAEPFSNGFSVDIENHYSHYNEIVRYKAYQFPDNMKFEAGMAKISSTGQIDVSTGFQPANLHIRAGQQISSKNSVNEYWRSPMGRSKGYATLDEDGNLVDQQSIGTASSSDSTNAHRSIASDEYILNTVYVDQDANVKGRLRGKITGADSNSFSMQVDDKWSGTDEVFLYRAFGFSYYDFKIGYEVIGSEGTHSFETGFEPDAIDIYAEQQIESINDEVKTPSNSGCDNAGGWSNGFYENDDSRQWALATGRTSDSQNSHRYGSTTSNALFNKYSGRNGEDCGDFTGTVTGTTSNGFDMDFSYDSNFDSNYGQEMVYYRAFNFKLAPPQITSINFHNSTDEHAFEVVANISEGSNDVDSCEMTAEGKDGNSKTYSATVNKINETHSQCVYDRIEYDDALPWEDRHDQDNRLLNLNVTVKAEDIDGLSSQKTKSNTFPNNKPSVDEIHSINYSREHAFNISSEINFPDNKDSELGRCEIYLHFEGDTQDVSSASSLSYEGGDQASCEYSKVDETTFSNAEPGDVIEVEVKVFDHHGRKGNRTSYHVIPNRNPVIEDHSPRDGGYTSDYPVPLEVEASDQDDNEFYIYLFNHTDGHLLTKEKVSDFERVSYDWKVPEAHSEYKLRITVGDRWDNYTSVVKFQKIIGGKYSSSMDVNREYTSIVTSTNEIRDFYITLSNRIGAEKQMNVTLSGVNAEFGDGKNYREVTLGGYESEEVLIRVIPEETGEKTLAVTSENTDIGLNTTQEIPVYVKEPSTGSAPSEVSGIGFLQLLFVAVTASILYSLQL